MLNTVAAELRKLATLPSALVAATVGTALCLVITGMSASSLRGRLEAGAPDDGSALDLAINMSGPGVVSVIVLGIVIISSEYTPNSKDAGGGRQIPVTLTATPRRGRLLAAKVVALALVSAVIAAVTLGGALLISQAVLGGHGPGWGELAQALGWRPAGAVAYWVLTALIAFAVTVMTRNGVVPMVAFIANTTVVSVSFLLTRVTSLARYLPDVAGAQMFASGYPLDVAVSPMTGAAVMTAWTAALLVVAAAVFLRRDA